MSIGTEGVPKTVVLCLGKAVPLKASITTSKWDGAGSVNPGSGGDTREWNTSETDTYSRKEDM